MLTAVLDNKFVVSFITIFGTLSFLIAGCRLGVDGPRSRAPIHAVRDHGPYCPKLYARSDEYTTRMWRTNTSL